jgi:hypothetical protein
VYARYCLITAAPTRLDDWARIVEADALPAVESVPGSLGMSLYADPELGVAMLQSFWVSHDAMLHSEQAVPAARHSASLRAAVTATADRYRVPICELHPPFGATTGLRLTQMDIDPAKAPDAVAAYGDVAVPWLAEIEGFCGALLLVNQETGSLLSQTIFRQPESLTASRSVAAAARVDLATSTGCSIRAVAEFGLIFSTARESTARKSTAREPAQRTASRRT